MSYLSKELWRAYINEQNFTNPNEVPSSLKELFKDVLQEVLETELDKTLSYGKHAVSESSNSRNGYSKKTIKSELDEISLNIPRDCNGEFEPKIVPKHNGIEDKILSLYSKGITTKDIWE